MRVYRPQQPNSTVHVAPGAFHDTSDWRDARGKPITFQVVFKGGVASVDSRLGEYLIKEGHAQRTPLIIPGVGKLLKVVGAA